MKRRAHGRRPAAGLATAAWLLVGSTAVALVLGEIAVRAVGTDVHPALKYRFHPRYGWTMEPGFWKADNVQASGFRTPPPGSGGSGGPRLLLLGDSFTAGVEQPWESTFAGILARDVEARGGALSSLASGGWGTAQQYIALEEEGLDWRPDVVVLQVFPYNDVCNNGIEMAWTCSWQDHLRPYFVETAEGLRQRWLQPARGNLRTVSRLFGLLDRLAWKRRVGPLGEGQREFDRLTREFTKAQARRAGLTHRGQLYALVPEPSLPPPAEQAWSVTEALFEAVHAELDARGVPLVAVVVPFSRSFEPEWSSFKRRGPAAMVRDHDTRRTEAAFTRLGVPVVSLRRLIEDRGLAASDLFYSANRHLNTLGHEWTARWILEELSNLPPFRAEALE